MIARIWHGKVPAEKANAYRAFLRARAVPEYRSVPGNRGVRILERTDAEVVHFVTLTFWDDIAAIRAFAGPEEALAKYYPEDKEFLLEFEERVTHYAVVGAAD
jgi:heme-degrading monooxygenase HmoA